MTGSRAALLLLLGAGIFFGFALSKRLGREQAAAPPPPPPAENYPPPMVETEAFLNDMSDGAVAFRASCSGCHRLPDPSMYDAEGWRAIAGKMREHMEERNFPYSDEQIELAIAFLAEKTDRKLPDRGAGTP